MSDDTTAPSFYCSREHREDLTEQVKRALAEAPMPSVRLFGRANRPAEPAEQVVWITCSEGHDNIFRIRL
jgi:hypothetical protein